MRNEAHAVRWQRGCVGASWSVVVVLFTTTTTSGHHSSRSNSWCTHTPLARARHAHTARWRWPHCIAKRWEDTIREDGARMAAGGGGGGGDDSRARRCGRVLINASRRRTVCVRGRRERRARPGTSPHQPPGSPITQMREEVVGIHNIPGMKSSKATIPAYAILSSWEIQNITSNKQTKKKRKEKKE